MSDRIAVIRRGRTIKEFEAEELPKKEIAIQGD